MIQKKLSFFLFLLFPFSSLFAQEEPSKIIHHKNNFYEQKFLQESAETPVYDETTSPWFLEDFYQLEQSPNFLSWLKEDKFASQDWHGYRSKLVEKGIDLNFYASEELWGNTTGGVTQAFNNVGLLQASELFDLEKLLSWKRAYFFSHWIYIYGDNPNLSLTDSLLLPSAFAGYSTLRNTELWLEQYFFHDQLSLRVGQMMVDQEFLIANYSTLFINDSFAWPPFINANIPNGGPAYPMAAPGVRLHWKPQKDLMLSSVFIQSNVNSEEENNHGFYWNLHPNQGYLSINEAEYQFGYHFPTEIKGGAWLDTEWFPSSNNPEEKKWGNVGIYAICDHLLLPKKSIVQSEEKKPKSFDSEGLGCFGRIAYEPSDRNIINFFLDTGLTYKGLLPTRHQDVCGLGFSYAQLSPGAINYQERNYQATQQGTPLGSPINSIGVGVMGEFALEAMYQIQLTPWMNIKPDLQYLINQGTHENLGNAFLIGVQSNIVF